MFFSEYGFRCLPLIRHIGLNWEKLSIQGTSWLGFIKLLKKTRAILTLSWHPTPRPHYHRSWTPHCPSLPASIPPLTSSVQVPPGFFSSSKNGKVKNFSFDLNYRFTTKTDTGSSHRAGPVSPVSHALCVCVVLFTVVTCRLMRQTRQNSSIPQAAVCPCL